MVTAEVDARAPLELALQPLAQVANQSLLMVLAVVQLAILAKEVPSATAVRHMAGAVVIPSIAELDARARLELAQQQPPLLQAAKQSLLMDLAVHLPAIPVPALPLVTVVPRTGGAEAAQFIAVPAVKLPTVLAQVLLPPAQSPAQPPRALLEQPPPAQLLRALLEQR